MQITVLDDLTYAGNVANLREFERDPRFRFERGSIRDPDLVDDLARQVDAIVNFAAHTHVDRSFDNASTFVDVNAGGVAVLCDAARRYEHEVFLQISTDEVYGDIREGRAHEMERLNPRTPYAASKAGGEHIAWSYSESFGMPVVITRGSNSYGPYQYPEKLIPLLITNAIEGRPLPLYKDGSAVRDFLYAEDHCGAIDHLLHEASTPAIYNIGTGLETSGLQVAEAVLDMLGKPRGMIQFVADRPGHDYRYAVDVNRIIALGWEPRVTFAEGLERTVWWYREHEDWWRPLKSGEHWEDYYRKNYKPLVS